MQFERFIQGPYSQTWEIEITIAGPMCGYDVLALWGYQEFLRFSHLEPKFLQSLLKNYNGICITVRRLTRHSHKQGVLGQILLDNSDVKQGKYDWRDILNRIAKLDKVLPSWYKSRDYD